MHSPEPAPPPPPGAAGPAQHADSTPGPVPPDPATLSAAAPSSSAAGTHVQSPTQGARAARDSSPRETVPPAPPGYELLGVIGRGAMGVVYRARQVRLNRVVALKMILGSEWADPAVRIRFLLESEAVAAVKHPNVVQIHDSGQHDGHPYLTMELLDGGSLADRLRAGPSFTPAEAAALVEQLARAVQAVHEAGIIHRDLKPGNILFGGEESRGTSDEGKPGFGLVTRHSPLVTPRITDFGLAKRGVSELTRTGQLLGTPAYMAPEQAAGAGEFVGPGADVYALGVILYECLTGTRPFRAPDLQVLLYQVRYEDPRPPRALVAAVPRDLDLVCLRCLAKAPAERYTTAAALADDLTRFLTGQPVTVRAAGPIERGWKWVKRNRTVSAATAAVVLALAAGTGVSAWQALRAGNEADRAGRAERDAEQKARDEAAARSDADTRAKAELAARERATRLLANQLVVLADADWERNNCALARERLARVPPEERRWEWYYLRWKFEKDGFHIPAPAPQNAVAATADGTAIVGAGQDGVVRLWDARLGEPLGEWAAHTGGATCLAVVPDGRHLVTGGMDRAVRVWDLATRRVVRELKPHAGPINVLALDPDGARLAVGGSDGRVRVYRGLAGEPEMEFRDTPDEITALSFHPDGRRLMIGSTGYGPPERPVGLIVRDLATGDRVAAVQPGPVFRLGAFAPNGLWAIVSGGSDEVVLRDDRLGDPSGLPPFKPGGVVTCLAVSPDGFELAVGGSAGTVRITNIGQTDPVVARGHAGAVRAAAFTPDGNRVVTAGDDGIRVWAVPRNHVLDASAAGPNANSTFQFVGSSIRPPGGPDEGPRRSVRELIGVAALPASWSRGRPVSADGSTLAVESRRHGAIVYDAATGRPVTGARLGDLGAVTLSPDGTLAATRDGVWIGLHDTRTGRRRHRLPTIRADRQEPVHELTVPLARGLRGRFPTWAVTFGAIDLATRFAPVAFADVGFTPDGSRLAGLTEDGTVHFWDAASGTPQPGLRLGRRSQRIAFHPGGRHLAVAADREVVVWDLDGRRQAAILRGHTGPVLDVRFSDDGGRVATTSRDATARVWDARTGEPVVELRGHSDAVTAAVFDPDGERVFTASADRTVRVWDARTGQPVLDLPTPGEVITGLGFDRTGTRLQGDGDRSFLLPRAWEAPRTWDQDDETARRWRMTAPRPDWHAFVAAVAVIEGPGEFQTFMAAVHHRHLAKLLAARGDATAAIVHATRADALLVKHRARPAKPVDRPIAIPPARP